MRASKFLDKITKEFPSFRVRYKKESQVQRVIGWLLRPFNPHYMDKYATMIFSTLWLPETARDWTDEDWIILLRHEYIHLRDSHRYPVFYHLSYLFLLPAVFSMRAFWEYRAYVANLIYLYESSGYITNLDIDPIVDLFCSGAYLWMFPFRGYIRRKFEHAAALIQDERLSGEYPF